MRKKFLELKFEEELKKVENAEYYYNKLLRFNSLTMTLFIMNLVIISMSAVFEFLVIPTNGLLVNLIIFAFINGKIILGYCIKNFYLRNNLEI